VKVLLTGPFGNVGTSTLAELLQRGHQVRCFDLKTKANEKAAREFEGQIEVVWGDLRNPDDLAAAVRDQVVVIHLAFIIPKLSHTGLESEDRPDWAREINVGGTQNLVQAMKALPRPPKILFTSSVHVFGLTQDQPPPRTVADPVHPPEHYSQHKVECEEMIKASGLDWAIFRLGATLPVRLIMDPAMFDLPLDNRIEFAHGRDVGLALAKAVDCDAVWGKTLLVAGGPKCQFTYGDMVERILGAMGVGMLPEEAFASTPFAVDWMDTRESQRLLDYQCYTLDDYVQDMLKSLGPQQYLIRAFRPLARYYLLTRSPHLRKLGRDRARRSGMVRRLYRRTVEFLGFCFRFVYVLRSSWAQG